MKWHHLGLLTALVLVCSCFLKQDPPPTDQTGTPVSTGPVQGIISMDDFQTGTNELGGSVAASFSPVQAAAPAAHSLSFENFHVSSINKALMANHGQVVCETEHIPKASKDDEAVSLLNAGVITFGADAQTGSMALDEDANNSYSRKIDAGIPSDIYVFQAAGSQAVPAFSAKLSMPETLRSVAFSNITTTPPTTYGVSLNHTEPIQIKWAAPQIVNTNNMMVADIFSDTAQDTFHVRCEVAESDIGTSGILAWVLPTEYTTQVPVGNEGQVYLIRANILDYNGGNMQIETQGLRAQVLNVTID